MTSLDKYVFSRWDVFSLARWILTVTPSRVTFSSLFHSYRLRPALVFTSASPRNEIVTFHTNAAARVTNRRTPWFMLYYSASSSTTFFPPHNRAQSILVSINDDQRLNNGYKFKNHNQKSCMIWYSNPPIHTNTYLIHILYSFVSGSTTTRLT